VVKRVRDLVHRRALDDTGVGTAMGILFTKNTGEALRSAGALSTVGLAFVFALAIGFWLGTVFDGWLGTKPVLTIVCFFLGLAAGVLNVYRIVSQAFPRSAPSPPANAGDRIGPADSGDAPGDRELSDEDR
jgi:ATP synthase protein I